MEKSGGKPNNDCESARTGVLIIEKIMNHRKEKGLSEEKLAMMSGIRVSQLRMFEKGSSSPTMLMCLKLAKALELSLSDIISEAEKSQPA